MSVGLKKPYGAVPGVQRIKEIRLDDGTAVIEGSPDAQAIISAVRDAGYSAVAV